MAKIPKGHNKKVWAEFFSLQCIYIRELMPRPLSDTNNFYHYKSLLIPFHMCAIKHL